RAGLLDDEDVDAQFQQGIKLGGGERFHSPHVDAIGGCRHQYTTTPRMDSPECISSKPLLMSSSGMVWVIIGSIWILPSMYQSTIFGTSVRPRAPPKAVPIHWRPVTSW